MKPNAFLRYPIVVGLLTILLLGSVALNYFLFDQGRWYYTQLNAARLNPLGLDYYDITANQRHRTNPDLIRVVFFGDSRAASWPSPDLNRFEFLNRGIGSQTTKQALLRFDYHVKPLQPQVIIVQVGINDLKTAPLFPERTESIIVNCEANIQQVVARSTDIGATVVLTTIFPTGKVPLERRPFWSDDVVLAIDEVNSFIRSLEGENVIVFDAFSILADDGRMTNPEYGQDLLHLNAAGYERLNEEIVHILTSLD